MADSLNEILKAQIDALPLIPGRPLVVADADEVLVQFVKGLERFLARREMGIDLVSYHLLGNVKDMKTGEPVNPAKLKGMLGDFFAEETAALDPVPGAAKGLKALEQRAQIVVLTNIPHQYRPIRAQNLMGHGMDYPVITNDGLKDGALSQLQNRIDAPIVFMDDIAAHLEAAQKVLDDGICIHLIGDPRLSRLMTDDVAGTYRADDWADAQNHIESQLAVRGY